MRSRFSLRQHLGSSLVSTTLLVAGLAATVPATTASAAPGQPASASGSAPWRHGEVPQRGATLAAPAAGVTKASTTLLSYHGGTSIGGVTTPSAITGAPKVYLVFWGNQWGTPTTVASSGSVPSYTTYSGDPSNMAKALQLFFAGLGTGGETWSGVMTQYCSNVAAGATTCASTGPHVGYPTGGALAGVWNDNASAAPAAATAAQIAQEAVAAANHFGNSSNASNVNNQYFIVSPHGANPDGFLSGSYCAYHDYTGDPTIAGNTVPASMGAIAYTNMPYVTDVGASCGANFVNAGSAGTDDGVTIVAGHEFAETVTDQLPSGGWYANSNGYENGDLCAWKAVGTGQANTQNITFTTGVFPVQPTWANDANSGTGGCEVSHAVVTGVVGPAAKLVLATSPVLGASGAVLTTQPVVDEEDANGNIITSDSTSTLTVSSSSGSLGGTTTVTFNAGVATFSGLSFTGTSNPTFTFTDNNTNVPALTTATLALPGTVATKLVVSTQPAGAVDGVALTTQPVVTVEDANGVKVAGFSGSVSVTSNSPTLSGTTTVAVSNGVATFSGLTITGTTGSRTLTFTSSGLTSATSASFTLSVGAATALAFSTAPSTTATNGVTMSSQPKVKVVDVGGNTVTSATGTISAALVSTGSNSAVLAATTNPVSLSSGVASFAGVKITGTVGGYTLKFTDSTAGISSLTSATITLAPGAVASLKVVGTPSGSHANTLSPAPVVTAYDASNNVVTTSTASVVVTLATKSVTATLSGTTTVKLSSGVATFSSLKISAAGTFTLQFTLSTSSTISVTSSTITLS